MTDPALPAAAPIPSDTVVLPVGLRRPRPKDGNEAAALIRDLLVHWGLERRTVDAISVDVELAGADITRLTIAATGITLPNPDEPPQEPLPEGELEEVVGRIGELSLLAGAVRWEQSDVDGEFRLEGLPFTWLMLDGQLVGFRSEESATQDGRGYLRLETDLDRLVESIRVAAGRQVRQYGVQLRRLRLRATELGGRSYQVHGEAAARWKVLPVSGRISMVATIDDDLVLRFSDVRVSSANPLVALALAVGRRSLLEGLAEPIPLRQELGLDLIDLTLRVEPRLHIEASFAELR